MWRYLRNSAYYAFFRKAPPVQQIHQHLSCWDAAELNVVHRSSALRSVWLIRDCLDQRGRSNILSLLRQLAGEEPAVLLVLHLAICWISISL